MDGWNLPCFMANVTTVVLVLLILLLQHFDAATGRKLSVDRRGAGGACTIGGLAGCGYEMISALILPQPAGMIRRYALLYHTS